MSIVIGLTGGIATGKSTVADLFKEENIPVIDTDYIAKNVLEKDSIGYQQVVDFFGTEILLTDLQINRKLLGKMIFMNKAKRDHLNKIVHPLVLEETKRLIRLYKERGEAIIVVDVPLLFETNFDQITDYVCVVYITENKQIKRLMDRDLIDRDYALLKIRAQMPLEQKIIRADFVIDNNRSILNTKKQFKEMLKELEVK